MAEALELEELSEEQPETAEAHPAGKEQPSPDASEPQDSPEAAEPSEATEKPKEKKEILLPILTALLILTGIGEAVFWGYYGFSAHQNSLAVRRYEEQQKAREEERASLGITGGSTFGPSLKVENGTVTWRREEPASVPSSGGTDVPRREDGLRLSHYSVPKIYYTLADTDAEDILPAAPKIPEAPAAGTTGGGETPTST